MIIEKIVNTTYGVLEQALLKLGFDAFYSTNSFGLPCVVYENRDCNAVISLPARPKEEMMYGGHFIVAERMVEGKGIASRETFYKLLREMAQQESHAA